MAIEQPTIEELVVRCQRTLPEDTRAFEQLMQRYQGFVFRVAYRMLGNYHEAEELAQEVFLKVYRGIRTLDTPNGVTAWIHRITVNACLDVLGRGNRKLRTAPLTIDPDGEEEAYYADPSAATPEELLIREETRRCLARALSEMETDARAVLVLRDIEGNSYQEVSDALALGLSAVKMRIHRARLALQKLIVALCPDLAAMVRAA